MRLGAGQLAALAAVCREGSFDQAALVLGVTPSAISQRVKQLEEQLGAVLVIRASPCVPTAVGEALFRHAVHVELLERDLLREIDVTPREDAQSPVGLAIAVNADSLATWVLAALRSVAIDRHVRIEISVDDQDFTAQWLQSGRVLGVVTTAERAIQGCRVEPLGVMRYVATARPSFVRRWLGRGFTRAAAVDAPSLAYDRRDKMCGQFVVERFGGETPELHAHLLPSPHAYLEACLSGLGWGMNPDSLITRALQRGRLVDLAPGCTLDVPLYWQSWAIASRSIESLGAALVSGARAALARRRGR